MRSSRYLTTFSPLLTAWLALTQPKQVTRSRVWAFLSATVLAQKYRFFGVGGRQQAAFQRERAVRR